MSEPPSSAVTAVNVSLSIPRTGWIGGETVSPMAYAVADSDPATAADAAAEHAAALALDAHGPHDLLWPAPALVDFLLPEDAPLYAVGDVEDWSGVPVDWDGGMRVTDAALDLVHDGEEGGTYVAVDRQAIGGDMIEAVDTTATFADPLVELAPVTGQPTGFLPPTLDAPSHVDVAIDAAARVDLAAPDVLGPELSWLAALPEVDLHVGEAWAWSDTAGGYVFDHCV
ncbi:MAG TPA: hypothetical protein VJ890_08755 [Vineibacter sp.]|nr:hypothetical protein [Vineibacter sp.]